MTDRAVFDHVSLSSEGPTLALRLEAGQSLAVVGRAGSGKTQFLSVVSQVESAARGKVSLTGSVFRAVASEAGRRTKLQSLASSPGSGNNERAASALSATGLWHVRKSPMTDLSPGQRRAAMLLPALVSNADVVVIDGLLDGLDLWTLNEVAALLRRRLREGKTVCIATNMPNLAAQMDVLVVLDELQVRFAGSPNDLITAATVSRVEVHTESQPAVRALTRPFEVTITENAEVLQMEAAEGQQLAAKMLLEGYGDVKCIQLRNPTVESALLALL